MMAQLLAHLWGDYLLQSDWMANTKRLKWRAAAVHAFVYSLCFFPLVWRCHSPVRAIQVIFWTHAVIDHFGLARYLVWAKNLLGASDYWVMLEENTETTPAPVLWQGRRPTPPWRFCRATGYPPGRPVWLSVWLTIIADNTLHLTINYLALRYL